MSDAIDLKHALLLPQGFKWCEECQAAVLACAHGGPMTSNDVKRIADLCSRLAWVNPEVVKLLCDDNVRLRGLIADRMPGPRAGNPALWVMCPWCGTGSDHYAECPAFTPDGSVK